MTSKFKQLQRLKGLADLIKAEGEASLAQARQAERDIANRIVEIRATEESERSEVKDIADAVRMEPWLEWSRKTIQLEQARQARARAVCEDRLTALKTAFGRSAALDGLMERERIQQKLKRSGDQLS